MINRMPENVISNIMDRLPIQDAVRTSILCRNWRFTWTLLTQLLFDCKFFRYLESKKHVRLFYKKNLSKVLLHLKGSITEFVLYIPAEERKFKKEYNAMYKDIVEDINHWILFLSTKGLQKFSLINMRDQVEPMKLPNHLFSCLEMTHLKLRNCCLHPVPGFHCFSKLLAFNFEEVVFKSCKHGEFIAMCPLLEHLKINCNTVYGEKVKLGEIAKANLKVLSLMLYMLWDTVVTSSDILQLVASLPKLEMLTLDFAQGYTVLAKAGASNRFFGNLHRVMKLELEQIDYEDDIMVEFACDLINGLPNLQTLKMIPVESRRGVPGIPPDVSKVACSIKGNLRLQYVEFECFGSKIDEHFIESLLACSPSLKKMVVRCYGHHNRVCCPFATKWLKLIRASPIAEIHLRQP